MSFANYAENEALDHFLGTTGNTFVAQCYLQLHTADPGEDATTAVSSIGSRAAINFGAATGGVATQSGTASWVGVSLGASELITHWSIFDASSAGNAICKGAMAASKTVNNGDDVDVTGITVTID